MITGGIITLKVYTKHGESTLYLNPRHIIYTLIYEEAAKHKYPDGVNRETFGEVVAPGGAFQIPSREEAIEIAQSYIARPTATVTP